MITRRAVTGIRAGDTHLSYKTKLYKKQDLTDFFIVRAFESWLLDDFDKADQLVEAEGRRPAELVALLIPWLHEITQVAIDGTDAPRLKNLLDRTLDQIEVHYLRRGEPETAFLRDLVPIAKSLSDLAMGWRGLRVPDREVGGSAL